MGTGVVVGVIVDVCTLGFSKDMEVIDGVVRAETVDVVVDNTEVSRPEEATQPTPRIIASKLRKRVGINFFLIVFAFPIKVVSLT